MLRRSVCPRCRSYQIPPFSRVGIFPIHLDPPTQQHHEIFKVLLGIHDKPSTPATPSPPSSSGAVGGVVATSGRTACRARVPSKFWHLEPFAESLETDSQLAPFDELILLPNTRYPVSLRQSTHLAALSVLAARGIPRLHVDFTALEHPDDSMPFVHELTQQYHNSVLVHWLHDAYEMLNWRSFSEIKVRVPILLLQTNSLPLSLVSKPPPPAAAHLFEEGWATATPATTAAATATAEVSHAHSLLHSRIYQDSRKVKDRRLASYYTRAADHMKAQLQYREQRSHPALRRQQPQVATSAAPEPEGTAMDGGSGGGLQTNTVNVAALEGFPSQADRTSVRYPSLAFTAAARAVSPPRFSAEMEAGMAAALDMGSSPNNLSVTVDAAAAAGTATAATMPVNDVDHLVRGEWWLTQGGRGDDRVEVSRSYGNAASSSWLDAPPSLQKKRTPIDVIGESRPDRNGDDADFMSQEAAEVDGEEDEDVYDSEEEAVSDFVIAEDGMLEMCGGDGGEVARRRAAGEGDKAEDDSSGGRDRIVREARKKSGAAGVAASAVSASVASVASVAIGDATRELFKEFAEVRAELANMLKPRFSPSFSSSAGGRKEEGSSPSASSTVVAGATETSASWDTEQGKRRSHSHRRLLRHARSTRLPNSQGCLHLDPNSVISRRNVRELLAEIFPVLYLSHHVANNGTGSHANAHAHAYAHVHAHAQLMDDCSGDGATASPDGASGALAATAGMPAAAHIAAHAHTHASPSVRGGILDMHGNGGVPAALCDDPICADAFLDEMALLQQSGYSTTGADLMDEAHAAIVSMEPLIPMVEVHPVTRSTGADVRQALWEQDVTPATVLTDCVARYVESHGLYRDSRKSAEGAAGASRASSYASIFAPAGPETVGGPAMAASIGTSRGPGAAGMSLQAASYGAGGPAVSGSSPLASTAAINYNYGASKKMMQMKENAVMSFPGIIPRLELHYDKNNLLAREQYEKLKVFQCKDGAAPDLIVPIGGDGYMMHCIRNNWRRFIPFYGVNAGHVGYLLNDCATLEELFSYPLKLHTMNMLYCQAEKETETGERVLLSELAFNDAWVERYSGQTALIRILVNGEERIRRLRGDGVLVSTAAGSTAYSQALGASPVPVGAPLIQVVGSNVVSPAQWRPVHLDQEDQVEFEVVDNIKRPCRCFVDSVDVGNVTRMLVRSSRVAGVTLAFSRSCDLQNKLYQVQFPKTL